MKRKILLSFIALAWTFNLFAMEGNPPPYGDNNNSRPFTVHLDLTINQQPQFQSTSHPSVSHSTERVLWSTLDAPALNQLYYKGTGSYMDKGYLANHPFPVHLLGSYPTDWYELTDICAKGRDISHNQDNDLLKDVWANIAEQTGLLSTDGKDTVRADRQLRHIGNQMSNRNIDIYTARSLLEKLGYHPITMMSRGKTILDFSNFNPTVSTLNQALGTDVSPIVNNVAQNCRQQ